MRKKQNGLIRLLGVARAIVFALLLIVFVVAPLMENYRPYTSNTEQVGTAFLVEDESVPVIGELTSVLADEDRLYLIWENAMIVRVYDWDGSYLYSWWIPHEHRNDCIRSVWAQDGEVYINTKSNVLYHMVNDVFVDAQESHVGTPGLDFTRSVLPSWPVDGKKTTVEGTSFVLRGADVYRNDGDIPVKVVDRPDVFVLLTWKALWGIGLACIVLAAVLQYVLLRLQKR